MEFLDEGSANSTAEERGAKMRRLFPEILPRIGLEPTHLAALDPKSSVSTNSTIWAIESILRFLRFKVKSLNILNHFLVTWGHETFFDGASFFSYPCSRYVST